MVNGVNVYYVDSNFSAHSIGTITYGTTPVSMADNGLAIILVDGSSAGWAIDLDTHAFGPIPSGAPFYGSPRVDYLDTFFLLSVPNTNQWYISLSNSTYSMLTSVYGSIESGTTVGGSGYSDGTYTNHALLGGSGGGATGTFTITGGIVGDVAIVDPGAGYVIGDILTATGIGSGSNFTFQVVTIGGAFDPIDIATKNGYPDPIVGIIVMHREIWIIGQLTSEIWYNSGAADYPFQAMPGAFVEHGANSVYTITAQDLSVYFLSNDKQGRAIFMRGAQYQAFRISTFAIENEWSTYRTTEDAISFVYQEEGHTFIFVVFPSANKTWVFDQASELWHERAWTDNDGNLNRHRANCCANAYGKNVAGDWQNGNLYAFDLDTYIDNVDGSGLNSDGSYPISRLRSFPHLVEGSHRISYQQFIADIDVGQETINEPIGSDPVGTVNPYPVVSLRWSDTKGASWGNKLEQSLGSSGQYLTNIQWRRLGMARDRVFELSWSMNGPTALNGAYVEVTECGT